LMFKHPLKQKKSPGNNRGLICLPHSDCITHPEQRLYATTMLYFESDLS
jgi:hypothetical protein